MSRLALLALVLALFSCSSTPVGSGLYSDTDNILVDRKRETYIDANASRRGRMLCTYRDGSTLTVLGGYNCPPVYPDEG